MMKRMLSMLLALMLLLALMPAKAEASVPEQLYRIVLRTEEGDVTLGSGVLFGSKTALLTAASCWAEGELVAIGADGEHAISYRGMVMGTQLITLGLATESAAEPLTVTTADYLMDYVLYGVAPDGSFVNMEVRGSRKTLVDNRAEALLYAEEGLLPGAVMFGDDFGLACVTVHQAGEGEGAYAAVADVTLAHVFGEGAVAAAGAKVISGVTAKYERGMIVVDWSAAAGYTLTEDTIFTAYVAATTNNYLSLDVLEDGETTTSFPAMPETEVMVWVVASQGDEDTQLFPETLAQMQYVTVPEAAPIDLYGLKNVRVGITPGEPGVDGNAADFLPQEPLTRETLSDRDRPIYFQTEDVYTIDVQDEDHTLMVTLYTPEGYAHSYFSGYVFMPEYAASDLWISDISDVFADYEMFCEGAPWPAGEYRVLYTIDGFEVAEFTFTLDAE